MKGSLKVITDGAKDYRLQRDTQQENLADGDDWPAALVVPPLVVGEVHVWRFSLEMRSDAELESLQSFLNEEEIKRANRFFFPRDQRKFTVGRAVLRAILGHYLKQPPQTLQFEFGPQGKPSLIAQHQPISDCLEFNLSHSHELALLAVTLNRQVGVDLEYIKEGRNISNLTGQVFTPPELAKFKQIQADRQQEAFYNAWTRKEAYMKACGGGLSVGLDQIEVSFDPTEPARILRINGETGFAAGWSLVALSVGETYKSALVVEGSPFRLILREWHPELGTDLLNSNQNKL